MKPGDWCGKTVICVASGPSITHEDCALAESSGHKIIAVNNSWQLVKADIIYASDYAWWKRYAGDLHSSAKRWSNCRKARDYRCEFFPKAMGCNSGLAAIYLADWLGAGRIFLLGYDCQPTDGKVHWHGAHPQLKNPNEISYRIWQKQYRHTSSHLRNKVVNCSRETAIKVFARCNLADWLSPNINQ